ncbi:MAG: ABC transporter substrate-binding protein [Clostridiales bacterium]|nr:ABC transporter substrate-binding protein [Clostridiales bacterium]
MMKNRWKKGKRAAAILLAGFTAFALAGCGSGDSSSDGSAASAGSSAEESSSTATAGSDGGLVTVRQALMTGNLDYYIAVIGKAQGIFEEYGVDLEYTEYAYGINTIDAVVNGTADIGNMANYALVNRFGNTSQDTDLIIFSELSSNSGQNGGLYVSPEYADDLSSLDGSIGFITTVGTVWDFYNSAIFEYLGFDESEQNIISTDSTQTALAVVQNNEAAAWYAYGANAEHAEDYGWVLAIPSEELGLTTGAYFVTSQSYNEENTEALAAWLEASQAAYDWINENQEEAAEYMENTTGLDPDDFYSTWESTVCAIGFSQEGVEDLEAMQEWCYANGKYDNEFVVRDFIDTSALELVFPEKVTIE